jgi:hypothetical protein
MSTLLSPSYNGVVSYLLAWVYLIISKFCFLFVDTVYYIMSFVNYYCENNHILIKDFWFLVKDLYRGYDRILVARSNHKIRY